MSLNIETKDNKNVVFEKTANFLSEKGLSIQSTDKKRPWGGFFKIQESDNQLFIENFFNDVPLNKVKTSEKLSPKILVVEPHKRLSWQYHFRRSEIWKVIDGTVKVVASETDEQTPAVIKNLNDVVILSKGERHRLIGNDTWGIVAEIWQHTDPENPSNEDDIVRLEDDFGR